MDTSSETLLLDQMAMALQKGSPLRPSMNKIIQHFIENGLYQIWTTQLMDTIPPKAHDSDTSAIKMNDSLKCKALADMLGEVDINGNASQGGDGLTDQMEQQMKKLAEEEITERNKGWEGLQTKADQQKSLAFIHALSSGLIVCPYCRISYLRSTGGHLLCDSCELRFESMVSIPEMIQTMKQIISNHSMSGCLDQFPQIGCWDSYIVVYCDTCPLRQISLVEPLRRSGRVYTSSVVFRLYTHLTAIILMAFCVLNTTHTLFGQPIHCEVTEGRFADQSMIDSYCYTSGIFAANRHPADAKPYGIHPGLGPKTPGIEYQKRYYLWIWFVLLLQSICFYFPHWLWKCCEGQQISTLVADMSLFTTDDDKRSAKIRKIVDYMYRTTGSHNSYAM
ncbi:unnamed protein product, partial [Medioppia subpectinata]